MPARSAPSRRLSLPPCPKSAVEVKVVFEVAHAA